MAKLFQCPECGKIISTRSQKCINCGYPIPQKICRSCGSSYASFSSTCPTCSKVEEESNINHTENLQESKTIEKEDQLPLKNKQKPWLVISFSVVIIIGLLGVIYQWQRNNNNPKIDSELEETGLSKTNELIQEDFHVFYKKFQVDSVFQKNRIIFPLITEYLDAPDYIVDTILSNEWNYCPFSWDSTDIEKTIDACNREIIVDLDTTKIQYLGINNGINSKVIFIRKKGKWFLYKVIDTSV